MDKKKSIIGVSFSLIVALLIALSFKSAFIYEYRDTTITIDTKVDSFQDIDFIDAFIIDNVRYIRFKDGYYNSYIYDKCDKISFEYGDKLKINFKKNRNASIILNIEDDIDIIEDDKTTTKEVLTNPLQENYYIVTSGKKITALSIVYFVLSFGLLFLVMHSFYKYFINKKISINKKVFIGTLLGVFIIGLYYYFTSQSSILYNDSSSYIDFSFKALLNLEFNGRTPVYPLIIHLSKALFQDDYLKFLCISQYALWFISLAFLYKTVMLLTKKSSISSLATILYALSPSIVGWNNVVLTESIALSGTIIFIYFIINYLKKGKLFDGIIALIISFILTFHRPTAIIYLVMLTCFFIVRIIFEKESRKDEIKCLIVSLSGILLVIVYAIIFHKTFGIYSISDAMPRQDLYVSLKEGFYKNSSDEEFIERADTALSKHPNDLWGSIGELRTYYDLKDIKKLTGEARSNSLSQYKDYVQRLIKDHIPVKYEGYAYTGINNFREVNKHIPSIFSIIIFGHSYIAIILCAIIFVIKWIKTKRIPYIYAGLFAFPLAIILSSFIGTCEEFMRTAICALPFTYISIVMLLFDLADFENYRQATYK